MRRRGLDRLLLALLFVQVAIGLYQHTVFFAELFRFPSRFGAAALSSAWIAPALALSVAAVAGLFARRARTRSATFAAAGLATLAALGLSHYAFGLASGRLSHGVTIALLAGALLAAGLGRARAPRRELEAAAPRAPWTLWDAGTGVFLATLLLTTVFDFVHFDAKAIWACRAAAFEARGSLAGVVDCKLASYPPLYSLLLFAGGRDPLFSGRLLSWLLLVFFALFLRERLARLDERLGPPALLFFVATVHVWQGAATYYANVPLMVFLSAGSLLVLGEPTRFERLAGTLCLAAAVLTRPDGVYYLAVVASGALWFRWRRARPAPLLPLGVAAAVWGTWLLRPAAWREASLFFAAPNEGWRSVSSSAHDALAAVLNVFLESLQGQYLSHKGFGVAIYLFLGVALFRARRRTVVRERADAETSLLGLVTLGSFAAVALCYLAIPFVGDPVAAAQPFQGSYLDHYRHFIRVGLGRMTVHLYPFALLWVVAELRGGGASAEGAAPPAA